MGFPCALNSFDESAMCLFFINIFSLPLYSVPIASNISRWICPSNGQEMANPSIIIHWIQFLTHRILPRGLLIENPTLPSHVFQKYLSTCLSNTLIKRGQNNLDSREVRTKLDLVQYDSRKGNTYSNVFFHAFYIYLNDVQSTYNLLVLIACEPLLNLMTNYLICVAGKQWEALRFTRWY